MLLPSLSNVHCMPHILGQTIVAAVLPVLISGTSRFTTGKDSFLFARLGIRLLRSFLRHCVNLRRVEGAVEIWEILHVLLQNFVTFKLDSFWLSLLGSFRLIFPGQGSSVEKLLIFLHECLLILGFLNEWKVEGLINLITLKLL